MICLCRLRAVFLWVIYLPKYLDRDNPWGFSGSDELDFSDSAPWQPNETLNRFGANENPPLEQWLWTRLNGQQWEPDEVWSKKRNDD